MTTPCPPDPPNAPSTEAKFPAGSAPENRIPKLSAICSFGESPLLITGALCQILQQQFTDPRNIRNETTRKIIEREGPWQRDDPDNGIYIESLANWRPELTQTRPAIIVKDGDWEFRREGIGNQMGADVETGELYFGGFWYGSHSVFVIGENGGETKRISGEVVKNFLQFGQLIADQLDLHRFTVAKWGALASLDEYPEHYVCPIDLAYVLQEQWSVQVEAPRLKTIEFWPDLMQ